MTSRELRKRLYKKWPSLRPWIFDRKYETISRLKLKQLLYENRIDKKKYVKDSFDCDDFALQLHAAIKRKGNYAFGEVHGTFRGNSTYHAVNICICKHCIVLIEPQTDKIWTCTEDDKVYRLRI